MTTKTALNGISLNAVTATGDGDAFMFTVPKTVASMAAFLQGAPSDAALVALEVTLDGVNWVAAGPVLSMTANGAGVDTQFGSLTGAAFIGARASLLTLTPHSSTPTVIASIAVA